MNDYKLIEDIPDCSRTIQLLNIRIVSGDTLICDVKQGSTITKDQDLRLAGIDCVAVYGDYKETGQKIADLLHTILSEADGPFWFIELAPRDSEDRLLGDILIQNHTSSLVHFLIDEGLAKPYTPKTNKKCKFTKEEIAEAKQLLSELASE